ncbi:hypothetical protein HK101_007647 [Irineochytrium annulatum]|nr:hypothetical protein HK101_007647 [Irineochytrium annulatum]
MCPAMFAKVSACLEVLNRTTSVFASQVLSRKLQTLANAIDGAEYFTTSDDPQVTTVTLCGTVFVVDIDVKATGEIVKAKLTYASEDIPTDDGVDRVLADLLRKNDTASFAACIRHLTLLDRHMDLHHLGRALQTDLEAIHALEVAGANGGAGNEYESKREAMSRGHGLPLVNFKRLGTTLVIWERKGRDGAVDVDDKYASDDYAKALITMDECEQTAYYLPKDSTGYLVKAGDMISMATVTDAGCVSAKVALKIELDPPIACTREFAQMIFAKAGVEVQAPLPEPAKRLEEILAPSKPVKAGNKTSSETDAHVLRFEFSCEALDSCVLSSIRFGHPVVLLPVFTVSHAFEHNI